MRGRVCLRWCVCNLGYAAESTPDQVPAYAGRLDSFGQASRHSRPFMSTAGARNVWSHGSNVFSLSPSPFHTVC